MTDAYSASSLSCAKGTRSRATSGKTKVAAKNKAMMSAAGSSRVGDEDVDMVDVECTRDDGERQEDRHSDDDNDDMGDDGGGGDEDDEEDEGIDTEEMLHGRRSVPLVKALPSLEKTHSAPAGRFPLLRGCTSKC